LTKGSSGSVQDAKMPAAPCSAAKSFSVLGLAIGKVRNLYRGIFYIQSTIINEFETDPTHCAVRMLFV